METKSIVLGGGCFWCLDATFSQLSGVVQVTAGYAGGELENPTYEKHGHHAEVVKIDYNPNVIKLDQLLQVFWTIHDPTTLNRQGADVGPQYRSIMLYQDEAQKKSFEESCKEAQHLWDDPIVTEIVPLDKFYKAEDYHQDYYEKNPEAAYCQAVINPKLEKLQNKFADLLK